MEWFLQGRNANLFSTQKVLAWRSSCNLCGQRSFQTLPKTLLLNLLFSSSIYKGWTYLYGRCLMYFTKSFHPIKVTVEVCLYITLKVLVLSFSHILCHVTVTFVVPSCKQQLGLCQMLNMSLLWFRTSHSSEYEEANSVFTRNSVVKGFWWQQPIMEPWHYSALLCHCHDNKVPRISLYSLE